MPGRVVDFGYGKKENAAGKAALCLKIFTCILSDPMINYRYVARYGCLPLWCRQRSRRPRIETIVFLVKAKHLIYVLCRALWMLCAWYLERSPDTRIEIIIFSVMKMSGLDFNLSHSISFNVCRSSV